MLLNLPNYTLLSFSETESNIQATIQPNSNPTHCPICYSNHIKKHGIRDVNYFDLPIRNKPVTLKIKIQRYRCFECHKVFAQELSEMSETFKMSKRLEEYIKTNSIQKPFRYLADELGISESYVRKVFRLYIEDLEKKFEFETPKQMGIDEIHISRKPRCVITNIEKRTIIDLLKNRNKATLIKYLKGLKNPHVILNVTMDMWKPYKDAVTQVLPNAVIVIDKFHVLRMANTALDSVRKSIRSTLTQSQRRDLKNDRFILLKRESTLNPREQLLLSHWMQNYPLLGKAYKLKEQFYDIYEAKDIHEAYDRYAEWESNVTTDIQPYFDDLIKAIGNWHIEIFSYFNYPITNAYTESLNSVIRHIDRMGRSYSFESLRAKILYTSNSFLIEKDSTQKGMQDMALLKKNYGVSLEKLSQKLKSGDLMLRVENL